MCGLYSPDVLRDIGDAPGCSAQFTDDPAAATLLSTWGEELRATPIRPEHIHVQGDRAEVSMAEVTEQARPDVIVWECQADTWLVTDESLFPPPQFDVETLIP